MTIFHAFTQTWPGIVNAMISDIQIKSGNDVINARGLWDTGASKTCISLECASKLNLISTGYCNNLTASGSRIGKTYLVDIILPNKVIIQNVMVNDAEIGAQNIDALIGMDLIAFGDFSVSNFDGRTVLTYRIPSRQITDYVYEINVENEKNRNSTQTNNLC